MIRRFTLLFLIWAMFSPAQASEPQAPIEADGVGAVMRGVLTRIKLKHTGCSLRAKPIDRRRAPLSVSIRRSETPEIWILDVTGNIPGTYDIAEYVECADGQPVDLSPVTVVIVSALPPGRHANLSRVPRPELSIDRDSSASWTIAMLGIWGILTVGWLAFRTTRSVARETKLLEAEPTPTDPHLLLIKAIGARPMTIPERGRLELITLRKLGRRHLAASPDSPLELYRCLRQEPQALPIVEALESWLHHPNASDSDARTLRKLLSEQFYPNTDEILEAAS